jgi:hypothetical protein
MFKLEGIELVSWTASNERTYECSGEVCGTGNERRTCNVLVPVKLKSIDIRGRIAPRRNEPRAGDSHHSTELAPSSAGRCLTQDKAVLMRTNLTFLSVQSSRCRSLPHAVDRLFLRGTRSLARHILIVNPVIHSPLLFLTSCLSCMWILITPVPSNVPGIALYFTS